MAKKLKATARAKDTQLAAAVKDSAQQIWLAGLGAYGKAQDEGGKVFEALVREGTSIQKRTMKVTEDKVNEVTSKVTKAATRLSKQANGTWDKLEGVFEQRVERALTRLGVPTNKEVAALTKRVEALTASVQALTKTAKPTRAVKTAAPKAAPKKAVKKVAKKVVKTAAKTAPIATAAKTVKKAVKRVERVAKKVATDVVAEVQAA
ncbi:MAG: phasin family protein [Burkholderiaceae bacterium]